MRADSSITEVFDAEGQACSGVLIREHDNSPVLFVVARVEFGERYDDLMGRAGRIAKALSVDRPKRLSAPKRAADSD